MKECPEWADMCVIFKGKVLKNLLKLTEILNKKDIANLSRSAFICYCWILEEQSSEQTIISIPNALWDQLLADPNYKEILSADNVKELKNYTENKKEEFGMFFESIRSKSEAVQ